MPELIKESRSLGDDDRLRAILNEICEMTGMGFAAVARVTEHRWIACQVADTLDFGLAPGGELDVRKTICDEIREYGETVVIDDANAKATYGTVGGEFAGWFQWQPLWQKISQDNPDIYD